MLEKVLVFLSTFLLVTAEPNSEGCAVLKYKNITGSPEKSYDSRDTCPEGNGPRAFLYIPTENPPSGESHHHHGLIGPTTKLVLKEVAPQGKQSFQCLTDRKCYIVVRGFGLRHLDALAILPAGVKACPPEENLLSDQEQQDDMPVIVQSERIALMATSSQDTVEASFTEFELPDRQSLAKGLHTVCYAPVLASQANDVNQLKASDFHYKAGVIQIGDNLLHCDFEDDLGVPSEGDLADSPLPCGFRNYRPRWDMNLIWQLGSGETETPATGPDGDSTPSLDKNGHYMYMDSPGYALGSQAYLVSIPIAFPSGGFCAKFQYNMHGADVSSLRVYIHNVRLIGLKSIPNPEVNRLGDWGSPKWVAVGNKGKGWHAGGFEFEAKSIEVFQLVFEALAGQSEQGDIAIDDVDISPGRCPSNVKHSLPKTIGFGNQALICGEVRLITGHHSADKSWHVDGAISCSGKGYSIDHLNNTAWLPCCVPHFGTYQLVLEDKFGDGWTGSRLEFRFFDRVMLYGTDSFQTSGFDKVYNLIIGSLEIIEIEKSEANKIDMLVRIARPQSYAWCGVVQTGKNGKPLKADLTPSILKKYGVRSFKPTSKSNEIVEMKIRNVLKQNAEYDLYCYSEVVGEEVSDNDESHLEQQKREIASSRVRISTDKDPPKLSNISLEGSFTNINVTFTIDETASIYCAAIKSTEEHHESLFADNGPLGGVLQHSKDKDHKLRMSQFFQTSGYGQDVVVAAAAVEPNQKTTQWVLIESLIPDTQYEIYCYAEDTASPTPNAMSAQDVLNTLLVSSTAPKVPTVTIARKQTLHKGFRLFVKTDAPGRVWCAAAPTDYGVPLVEDVVRVGATVEMTEPGKLESLEVRGVQPNTAYDLYCVAGTRTKEAQETPEYSTSDEMIGHAVSLISYGKYCEELDGPDIYAVTNELTPFHPISAEEEMLVRNFVLGRPELDLQGVYRINILPNKSEIYDYYDGKGPLPQRYARVRAGRCVDGKGLYEQLRVGPLGGGALHYERIAQPIDTDCGGYNPQGVFGRRLLDRDEWETNEKQLSSWFRKTFNYDFGTQDCRDESAAMSVRRQESQGILGQSKSAKQKKKCLELGPIIVQEVCSTTDESTPCNALAREGKVWVGLKTPEGDQIPFYFIYELPTSSSSQKRNNKEKANDDDDETPEEWVRRIIRNKELPPDFHEFWTVRELWVDGHVFDSISKVFEADKNGTFDSLTPQHLAERRRLRDQELTAEGIRQRRRLEPAPFAGAAGTAGPLPSRQTRRGGLEYRVHPEHVEPQGKRFTLQATSDQEAFIINYSGWNMTVTNDRDTALIVYYLSFQGQRIAFELGLMEALAHYSVSERNWFFLDSWYGGLGAAARKVHKGIECPKTAVSLFWDGSLCVFEQDMARPARSHWKSGEIRDGAPHTSLVLRQMLTVSNYDYVTDYRFHASGIFEASVSFTGELYAGIEVPWYSARQADYGVQVTGANRFAALHNHMAAWKIDFDVGPGDDWKHNSVFLTEVIPDAARPGANKLQRSFANTEREAALFRNDSRAIVYEVVDEKIKTFGNYGGWRVIPYPGINPLHHDFELYSGPAAWAKYRAFTTVHKYGELDSTLPRDNKYAKRPAVSVDRYIADNEPLRNTDVVTWISDGIFHLPVVEDMPLTVPIGNTLGWMVKPANLFFEDPSMDLHNAMGGGVEDPGTCAVVRIAVAEVEPTLEGVFNKIGAVPVRSREA